MSNVMLPPPILPPGEFDWYDFEGQFRRRKQEQEPFRVDYLVGRVALEDRIHTFEEKLYRGDPLSEDERDLLELIGEDLTDEYHPQ